MEHLGNPYDELEPLFNGLPVLVRLITKEDVLCILFQRAQQSTDDPDVRLYMERPLRLIMDEVYPESATVERESLGRTQTVYSTVRTRFDRWIPLTTAGLFPIYPDHILSIAPLSDQYVNSYISWADQLYADTKFPHASLDPATALKDQTEEEIRRSYIDYLLHQFNPKGKPN